MPEPLAELRRFQHADGRWLDEAPGFLLNVQSEEDRHSLYGLSQLLPFDWAWYVLYAVKHNT
jgi:hypothetical protein